MEKIFEQRYSYAAILPLMNYSKISDKPLGGSNFVNEKKLSLFLYDKSDLDDFSDSSPYLFQNVNSFTLNLKCIDFGGSWRKRKNNKVQYFYHKDGAEPYKLKLFCRNKNKSVFYTTKDRHIKKYYSDPFAKIEINTFSRSIYKDENKVVIKKIRVIKRRNVNWIFFKKMTNIETISFNLKTGNFILINEEKNGHKSFRTNSFIRLDSFFELGLLKTIDCDDDFISNDIKNIYDNDRFLDAINKSLFVNPVNKLTKENIIDTILDDFVIKRKIKTPNVYKHLLMNFYPTNKFLKKNNNKLVQSVLDMFNIKTKQNIKILHEHPEVKITTLAHICYLFGNDFYNYINKVPVKVFFDGTVDFKGNLDERYKLYGFTTKKEKDNLLKVIIDSSTSNVNNLDTMLMDHFVMMEVIKKYYPETMFTPKTLKDFNKQHLEFTNIINKIKKGFTTEYQFDEKLLTDIESEIVALKDNYSLITIKPFILKRDEDYNEEGLFMHHCVSTYLSKDKSIIISLRTVDEQDRVTCEFNIQTGKILQKRHFCNRTPPDYFTDAIDLIESKVLKYARWGLLNWKEKKIVPIKINGIEVEVEDHKPKTFQDVLWDEFF